MKKWKQALSLTLALALSLALAVPAMAVGTTETAEVRTGIVVEITNFLKKETMLLNLGDSNDQEEFTVYVVSDSGSTVTFKAAPGYEYGTAGFEYLTCKVDTGKKSVIFWSVKGDLLSGPMAKPMEAYAPTKDTEYSRWENNIVIYESVYNKLISGSSSTPAQPEQPEQPTTPVVAAGTTEKITLGSTVMTVTNVLKVVNEQYNVGTDPYNGVGKITGQEEFTFLVVSDSGFTMTLEAAPGYIYDRPGLSEEEEMKVAHYAYMGYSWIPEQKYLFAYGGDGTMLDGPITDTIGSYSPGGDPNQVDVIDWNHSNLSNKRIGILYESEYAKLAPAAPAKPAAMPTNDKLTVNGEVQNPTVYKIDGNNYFKIRDLAAVLNGTEKQIDVGYDGKLNSVTVTTGKSYAKLDTDLAGAATGGNQTADPSNDTIYIDGQKTDAVVYKIGGNNYFKLRDLGKALDFYVGWTKEGGVFIDTSKPYSE